MTEEPNLGDDRYDGHDHSSAIMVEDNGTQIIVGEGAVVEEDCTQETVTNEESNLGVGERVEQDIDSIVAGEDGGSAQMGFDE